MAFCVILHCATTIMRSLYCYAYKPFLVWWAWPVVEHVVWLVFSYIAFNIITSSQTYNSTEYCTPQSNHRDTFFSIYLVCGLILNSSLYTFIGKNDIDLEFVESENHLETANDAVVNSPVDPPVDPTVVTPNKFPTVLHHNKTRVEDQVLSKISKPESSSTFGSGEPGELILVTQVISYNLEFSQ